MNENEMLLRIKKATLYFYHEFKEETGDTHVALRLVTEAMATYRTLLINEEKEKSKSDKITEKQYSLLSEAMSNFEESPIVISGLQKYGKSDISELTKDEARMIIHDIISNKGSD